MSAYLVASEDGDPSATLSPDDLDDLRGLLLAERASRGVRLAEYEAMLFGTGADALGAEVRRFARTSIVRTREAIDDVDDALARLVQTYGSCEWCDSDIPSEQLTAIPEERLCAACRRR